MRSYLLGQHHGMLGGTRTLIAYAPSRNRTDFHLSHEHAMVLTIVICVYNEMRVLVYHSNHTTCVQHYKKQNIYYLF